MTKGLNPMDIIAQNKRLFSFNDRQLQIRRCLYQANKIYRWPFSAGDHPIRRTVNSADAELRVLFLGFCFSSLRSRIFDKSAYFPAFPAFIGQEYSFPEKHCVHRNVGIPFLFSRVSRTYRPIKSGTCPLSLLPAPLHHCRAAGIMYKEEMQIAALRRDPKRGDSAHSGSFRPSCTSRSHRVHGE